MDTLNSILLSDLHFEHVQWLNELRFWEGELNSFNNRLNETIQKDIEQNVKIKIEHFYNKFLIHGNAIDQIKNEIKQHESHLAQLAINFDDNLSNNFLEKHADVRDKLNIERNMYGELKNEYYTFLTQVRKDLQFS